MHKISERTHETEGWNFIRSLTNHDNFSSSLPKIISLYQKSYKNMQSGIRRFAFAAQYSTY